MKFDWKEDGTVNPALLEAGVVAPVGRWRCYVDGKSLGCVAQHKNGGDRSFYWGTKWLSASLTYPTDTFVAAKVLVEENIRKAILEEGRE